VPEQRVDLQVITGASAGAITGALGVVALARGIRPQKLTDEEKRNTYPLPPERRCKISAYCPRFMRLGSLVPERSIQPAASIEHRGT
jgi:hypothetical protein